LGVETKELSPDIAGKILDADFQNIVKKVAAGKPLTVAERARIESRAAGSAETLAYAKTLVELAAVLGVSRRTLTNWQKMEGAPKALSNGLWPVADWREFVRLRGLNAGRVPVGNEEALKPDESLDSFQSSRPSPTFTGFLEHLRRDSALGMIPFEFAADSSKIGGAGVRLIVAKADRRFSFRQMILEKRLIRPVWAYVIGDAIARGLLPSVPTWWRISTVPPKRVTCDAGREAQQNRADVEMGLKTLSDHYAELGADFREEIERRGADAKLILETAAKYGVPPEMLWKAAAV
jgi:hypothetical protein